MLREISTEQMLEWQGFYRLEPFGEEWMQSAGVCASTFTAMTGAKFEPDKFLPVGPLEADDPVGDQLFETMSKLAAIYGRAN
jgi:hypothetical protein